MMETLPRNMIFKHGAYYLVAMTDRKRKWTNLGRDRKLAVNRYGRMRGVGEAEATWKALSKVFSNCKSKAKLRGIQFYLTKAQFDDMARRGDMRCELTGIPFSLTWAGSSKHRRAYVPSLDRVDPNGPYDVDNCRLVLSSVNYAMNEWGEAVFRKISRAYIDNNGKEV